MNPMNDSLYSVCDWLVLINIFELGLFRANVSMPANQMQSKEE